MVSDNYCFVFQALSCFLRNVSVKMSIYLGTLLSNMGVINSCGF